MTQNQQNNQQGGKGNKGKKRVNHVFELVGQHCADELSKWQKDNDITVQIMDELITADNDEIQRAYSTGKFTSAYRVVIGVTWKNLAKNNNINEKSDCPTLENIFEIVAEKIQEQEAKKTTEDVSNSPVLSLTSEELQGVMEAFTSVLRKERKIVEYWMNEFLTSTQRLILIKALSGAQKQTAVDTIKDLASCKSDKKRTKKAETLGLTEFGNPSIIIEAIDKLEDNKKSSMLKHLEALESRKRKQLISGLCVLSEKARASIIKTLSCQTDDQGFIQQAEVFGLIKGEL